MKLTGKDKIYLRGLGHHLKPIIQVGKEGVSEKFVENLKALFEDHELLKVKALENAPQKVKETAKLIESGAVGCAVAQVIGKTVLLYKPFKDEPEIKLPGKK